MSTATIAGHEIEVNEDGFMLNPDQWTPEIASEIARESGIDQLTDKHWQVIDFCRRDAADKGEPPGVRRITKNAGVSMKEMYQLFPRGPGILAAKISGLTKPKGCI
ncbi:TusE/DsrC/DsvC family sulfur relay protein [Gemmatimonadota bacterium]